MKLSIVIPAYNEEQRLPVTLDALHAYFTSGSSAFSLHEVIVVDDGSTDATSRVAQEWSGKLPMNVIRYTPNRGKGAAAKKGMLAATGDYALLYDADGATPIEELGRFSAILKERNVDVIIGSRIKGDRRGIVSMSWHRRLMGRVYHLLTSLLVPRLEDTACGFKLFKREVARDLFVLQRIERFAFDVEILSYALGLGYTVEEIPVRWHAVDGSKVHVVRDTIHMTWCVLGLHVRHLLNMRKWKRLYRGES